tara:strand:+ start:6721 stop:7035 length:315 start_codon:yes stop_codon:yes gene_type:complete
MADEVKIEDRPFKSEFVNRKKVEDFFKEVRVGDEVSVHCREVRAGTVGTTHSYIVEGRVKSKCEFFVDDDVGGVRIERTTREGEEIEESVRYMNILDYKILENA